MVKPKSLPYILLLPSLLIPRVVVHDLHLMPINGTSYTLLAVVPLLVWLVVAVARRTEQPMREFLMYGLVYGLLLATAHQISWTASWGANVPHLGGNLAGKLDPLTESLLLRTAAFLSSVATGLVTGALFGGVALLAGRVLRRRKA